MGKIVDVMNEYMKEGKPFFSFEYFPPKTPDGVDNLFERMDRMVSYGPTFCDITWGAGGSTAELTLDIADRMQNEINVECMMHLTCTNMPEEKLATALAALKKFGVKNILALRGDPPQGQEKFQAVDGGFSCALDLIKYIRNETGTAPPHAFALSPLPSGCRKPCWWPPQEPRASITAHRTPCVPAPLHAAGAPLCYCVDAVSIFASGAARPLWRCHVRRRQQPRAACR